MNPLFITPIFEFGNALLKRFLPDPTAQAAAQLELLKLQQTGEFKELDAAMQTALAQIAVNTVEANSGSTFRGGWRPFVGWVCGCGLAYQLLLRPLLQMCINLYGSDVPLLSLDINTLTTLLFGMLGLSAMRSVEKVKGVA